MLKTKRCLIISFAVLLLCGAVFAEEQTQQQPSQSVVATPPITQGQAPQYINEKGDTVSFCDQSGRPVTREQFNEMARAGNAEINRGAQRVISEFRAEQSNSTQELTEEQKKAGDESVEALVKANKEMDERTAQGEQERAKYIEVPKVLVSTESNRKP